MRNHQLLCPGPNPTLAIVLDLEAPVLYDLRSLADEETSIANRTQALSTENVVLELRV